MRVIGNIAAVIVLAIGVLWTLQGSNVISGSGMSGQQNWLYAGLIAAVAGVGLLLWINARRASGR